MSDSLTPFNTSIIKDFIKRLRDDIDEATLNSITKRILKRRSNELINEFINVYVEVIAELGLVTNIDNPFANRTPQSGSTTQYQVIPQIDSRNEFPEGTSRSESTNRDSRDDTSLTNDPRSGLCEANEEQFFTWTDKDKQLHIDNFLICCYKELINISGKELYNKYINFLSEKYPSTTTPSSRSFIKNIKRFTGNAKQKWVRKVDPNDKSKVITLYSLTPEVYISLMRLHSRSELHCVDNESLEKLN